MIQSVDPLTPIGGALTAGVASAALGYTIRKDAGTGRFTVDPVTGQPGANSWPEGWPEDWMELARPEPLFVDGAWYTHKPDYRIKQKIKGAVKHGADADADAEADESDGDDGYQTFFPFRIQWEQLKLDLELTDKRLAQEAAKLQQELTDFELRYTKAHQGYTKELSRAKVLTGEAAGLNAGDLETSSDPDVMRSIRQNWVRTRQALKAERAAIQDRYSAEVVSYNLRVRKARDIQPGLFWMRNVQIVQLDRLPGRGATPRVKAGVTATLKVVGGKVSDREHGFVDIQLDWTESHRVQGSYTWKSAMRINALGEIPSGEGKLYERFRAWKTADRGVRSSKADGARRLAAVHTAHQEGRVFAEIPGVKPRIPTSPPATHSSATRRPPFVDQALRLHVNGEAMGLHIEMSEDRIVTFSMTRDLRGPRQLRISRTSRTEFRITNAKKMRTDLRNVLTSAFRSRCMTVTIED